MGIGNIANTGMNAALSNMETISNNIANANTYGFKRSRINFSDVYPTSGGTASASPGLGVQIDGITQDFSTGGRDLTNIRTDFGIARDGFFVMKNPNSGVVTYTRYGRFDLNKDHYLEFNGSRLQGYAANNGSITSGSLSDIYVDPTPLPASATSRITCTNMNLDASSDVPSTTFDKTDPTSYNFKSTSVLYDSLGNSYNATMYYVKSAANTWDVHVDVDGTTIGSGTATFDANGVLSGTTGLTGLSFTPTSGATSPQSFDVDISNTTQFALPSKDGIVTQDGYRAGTLANFEFDSDGILTLQYSNGQNVIGGQIAVATFASNDGLQNVGSMSWAATSASGNALLSSANSSANILQGELELSNVDLTEEMVNLISAQHTFQANAQVEQTYDQVMQTVIKL